MNATTTTSSSTTESHQQPQHLCKRVSFAETQIRYFEQPKLPMKHICWYSPEDLIPCREEARSALQALQAANGNIDSVPAHHCTRGLEKYWDVISKVQGQGMLKESILEQQRMMYPRKCCPEHLATLSRYLSQPHKEMAHRFAIRNAIEVLDVDCDDWDDYDDDDSSCASDMTPTPGSPTSIAATPLSFSLVVNSPVSSTSTAQTTTNTTTNHHHCAATVSTLMLMAGKKRSPPPPPASTGTHPSHIGATAPSLYTRSVKPRLMEVSE